MRYDSRMSRAKITSGGQISIPATVRRRWATAEIEIEDLGDRLIVRPAESDPISAAYGAFAGRIPPTDWLRAKLREEEEAAFERRIRER